MVTIFLLLIGQKARNSGFDWFIQLSDNRYQITVYFVTGHSPINDLAVRSRGKKSVK